jgi:hypothetical protein
LGEIIAISYQLSAFNLRKIIEAFIGDNARLLSLATPENGKQKTENRINPCSP